MRNKAIFIPALSAAVLPAFQACAQKQQEPERYNIIHIMTDDHSYQTISAYGGPISALAPTPNLDRLASQGMLFTRAYVENSISSPSRATLLTGKYSHMHGQIKLGRKPEFNQEQMTFPKLLQEAGYQTAIFGKWHLWSRPQGFDNFKILNGQGTYYNPEFSTESNPEFVREEGYVANIVTNDAIDWLENRDRNRPFCLLVHHKSVHRNWFPELKYASLYEDVTFPEPETFNDDYSTRSDAARCQEMTIREHMKMVDDMKVFELLEKKNAKNNFNEEFLRMSPEQQEEFKSIYGPLNEKMLAQNLDEEELNHWKYQRYIKDYVRCVKSLDDEVGRLLDYLEENDMMKNTIIVYTSDQGFYMGEHNWFDKRFMYEESFRTPLIICCPDKIKPGTVCDELVQNIDYAPTYLAMAGVEIPEDVCGVPLLPLFGTGKAPADWRDELYYHYYDYPAIHNVRRHDGILTKDYKLIHFQDGGGGKKGTESPIDAWELYDLRNDPTEVNNVYDNPDYSDIVKDLEQRLENKRKEINIDDSQFNLEAWKNKKK